MERKCKNCLDRKRHGFFKKSYSVIVIYNMKKGSNLSLIGCFLCAICYRQILPLVVPLYAFGLSLKIRQAYFELDLAIPKHFSYFLGM